MSDVDARAQALRGTAGEAFGRDPDGVWWSREE